MDIAKMTAVREVIDEMLANETRIEQLSGLHENALVPAAVVKLLVGEMRTILETRKRKLVEELRKLGMAHLAQPAPAPSATPVLDSLVKCPPINGAVGGSYADAKALLDSNADACAESRVART